MSSKPDLIRFFKNVVLLFITLLACDFLIGKALSALYFSLKKGQFAQMTYSINNTSNTDVLVFGSSRAIRHYSPQLISGVTGLSCYNMGRDGQYIPFYTALEDAALRKHIPRFIIVDMNVWEFTVNYEKYEKLAALLPYARTNPEFIPYINEISDWENIKLVSRTYPFNSTLFIASHDFLLAKNLPGYESGYLPLTNSMSLREYENYRTEKNQYDLKRSKMKIEIDQKAIGYFKAFLDRAQKHNVKTFVIISPTILSEPETKEKKIIQSIAHTYPNVVFKDFSHDPTYNNQYNKFADVFHLNEQGSKEFSGQIAELLKN